MAVDKACDNKDCMRNKECARYEAFLNGDKNYKTFNGTPEKGCGRFIEKK